MSGKQLLAFSGRTVARQFRKNLYYLAKRTVFTQDALFGMEDRFNIKRMLDLEKSGGPSMLMNVKKYEIMTPFLAGSKAVVDNDDLTRLFELNTTTQRETEIYKLFPLSVLKSVQKRNGLFEISFQYSDDRDQWSPDSLLRAIVKHGKAKVLGARTDALFWSYLKRLKLTRDDIDEIFSVIDPASVIVSTKRLPKDKVDMHVESVEAADITMPSYTDIEFGTFFLGDEKEEDQLPRMQYNMACVVNGGHLIPTRTISTCLSDMLDLLKKEDEEAYRGKLAEFLLMTKGDTSKKCRSELIFDYLRKIPLFDCIFSQESEFMTNNVAALAVKADAYLLNLVKPSEALLVNLQLPYVLGEAPLIVTLLVRLDERGMIDVSELLTSEGDPLSLTAEKLDKRLENSVKYCGTPAANICILENPEDITDIITAVKEALGKKNASEKDPCKIFENRLDALFELFSDKRVKLRYLNGNRLALSAKSDGWHERQCAVEATSLVNFKRVAKSDPVKTITIPVGEGAGLWEEIDPDAIENYEWLPCWTVQIDERFAKERAVSTLPKGFPLPAFYPEHIGAASPLNPINTTWKLMTYNEFLELTKED